MPKRLLYILAAFVLALPAFSWGADSESAPPATELEALKARLDGLELAAKSDSRRWRIEGYTQIRYDEQQYKIAAVNAPGSGLPTVTTANHNVRGGYIKKFEIKTSGEVLPSVDWTAGFDFAEAKLKDLGISVSGLPLLPFAFPGHTWTLKAGQFRQPFGIEPQTGQPNLAFNERSLINGGATPLSPSAGTTALIGERVLGLHFIQKHSYGKYGYEAGAALSNDGTDQAKGSNSLGLAFPAQLNDENPAFTARFGLYGEAWGRHKAGVSFQHNSKNSAFMASTAAQIIADESLGVDWRTDFGKIAFVQAEWIGQNAGISSPGPVVSSRREGWYAQGGLDLLGLFASGAAQKVELLARCERVNMNVHGPAYSPTIGAGTLGLKWTYGKNSQSTLNYSFYGIDGNPGAAGNVSLLSLQQIVTY